MTKRREPLTIEKAIMRVAVEIGFEAIETAIGVKDRAVRNWSDPERPEQISLRDAITLDIAFHLAGGVGYPFQEVFEHQLQLSTGEAGADARQIAELAGIAAKEGAQAEAAILKAVLPGASDFDRAVAARELAEKISADQTTLAALAPVPSEHRESG